MLNFLQPKLLDVLETYLAVNTRVTSPSTLKHYRITLRQFEEHLGHCARLSDLTDENLASFMKFLLALDKSISTVNQKFNYVCAFWRWCAETNRVAKWPTVAAMIEPERIPDAWTLPQLEQLFTACRQRPGKIGDVPAADWWHSIHLFWYFTGERVSASLSAKWSDYDADGRTLLIPAGNRKGGQKAMLYDLLPQMTASLESIRDPTRELIWPWPYHSTSFYNHYRRLLESAGLPHIAWKSGPQKMRRSYASHLEAAGGDATLGLRHSRSALTRKPYIDPRIAKPKNQSILLPKVEVPR